jgi:hypothetical protein
MWSAVAARLMPFLSNASVWAGSKYGYGEAFTRPAWETFKAAFLRHFLDPNELQSTRLAYQNLSGTQYVSPTTGLVDIRAFNAAFRQAVMDLVFAHETAGLAEPDLMAICVDYKMKLMSTGLYNHVNNVMQNNAMNNRERAKEGRAAISLTIEDLMSEAMQFQQDQTQGTTLTAGPHTQVPTTMSPGTSETTTSPPAGIVPMDLDAIKATVQEELNAFKTSFRKPRGGMSGKNQRDGRERRAEGCWNCGGTDHFARGCRTRRNGGEGRKESGNGADQ